MDENVRPIEVSGAMDCDGGSVPQADDDERDEHAKTSLVILCVVCGRGRLGAAFYDQSASAVYIVKDVCEHLDDLRTLRQCTQSIEPNVLVAPAKSDARFIAQLRLLCQCALPPAHTAGDDGQPPQCDDSHRALGTSGGVVASPFNRPAATLAQYDQRRPTSPAHCDNDQDGDTTAICGQSVDDEDTATKPSLCLLAANCFNEREGRQRLSRLIADDSFNESENMLRLRMQIELKSDCMMRALNALLVYLETRRVGVEFDDQSATTPINKIVTYCLPATLDCDEDTQRSLQIFVEEQHPSAFKRGVYGTAKEGHSVFALCQRHTRSAVGRAELRRWWSRPLSSVCAIEQRFDAVAYLAHDANVDVAATVQKAVRNVKSVHGILRRMTMSSSVSVCDWLSLYKTIYSCVLMGNVLSSTNTQRQHHVNMLTELSASFSGRLAEVAQLISRTADLERMHSEVRFVVLPGVDVELDTCRQIYERLPNVLRVAASMEHSQHDGTLAHSQLSVAYLPLLGFLCVLPRTADCETVQHCEQLLARAIGGGQCEFVFMTSASIYFRNGTTRAFDQHYGDLKFKMYDLETCVRVELQRRIVSSSRRIIAAVRAAAQLDALVAMAAAAREHAWIRPTMDSEHNIDIKDGRHPLLERRVAFVANDTLATGGDSKLLIVTGPNASGKSVYLKQVGVLCYMAHVGCFVPARRATIPALDKIFSRVDIFDSVADAFSLFAHELHQVGGALRRASNRSLVLMDEFGKGTLADVGAAILGATLEFWLRDNGAHCPFVLVSTHLHQMVSLMPETALIGYRFMGTTTVLRVDGPTSLEYTYRLNVGTSDSHALYAARSLGIDESLVRRAERVYESLRRGQPVHTVPISDAEQVHALRDRSVVLVDDFLGVDLDSVADCDQFIQQLCDADANAQKELDTDATAVGDGDNADKRRRTPDKDDGRSPAQCANYEPESPLPASMQPHRTAPTSQQLLSPQSDVHYGKERSDTGDRPPANGHIAPSAASPDDRMEVDESAHSDVANDGDASDDGHADTDDRCADGELAAANASCNAQRGGGGQSNVASATSMHNVTARRSLFALDHNNNE